MLIRCSIVCYRNPAWQIERVLKSLASSAKTNPSISLSILLIDNSARNNLAAVAAQFDAEYIHLPRNPGFGAAHNVALSKSLADGAAYHLVLNPDTWFDSKVVGVLANFMQENEDVGLVMPDIRYPDGKRQYLCKLLPTPIDLLLRRFMPGFYKASGFLARYELRESGYSTVMDVPSLSGCFMFLRTSVLKEVGLFDERFFMYLEDVDFSRRIGKVSRTVFYPHVHITHEYVKGSYKSRRLLFNHIKSAILYFNKWGWLFDDERSKVNMLALRKIEMLIQANALK